MIEIGAKKKKDTRISVIQSDLEEPAALKEDDVREAASTTAQMGPPNKIMNMKSTTIRSGPKIMASIRCQLSGPSGSVERSSRDQGNSRSVALSLEITKFQLGSADTFNGDERSRTMGTTVTFGQRMDACGRNLLYMEQGESATLR
jgi:hypothetical protein